MSRSVTFNGITQFRPGGITKVDASELNQVTVGINSILGLIGESDGGIAQPGEIVTIDDPALAKSYFRDGALANALGVAFDPSDDDRVPGGAFRCYCVKVNSGTRSSLILYNKIDDKNITTATPTVLNFAPATFTEDEHNGNIARIGTYSSGVWSNFEDRTITDTGTGSITVSPGFSVAPGAGTTVHFFAPMHTVYSREYSLAANGVQHELEAGSIKGQIWTTIFEGVGQISDEVGGQAFLEVEYIGESLPVINSSGTATAGTINTLSDSGKSWTINAFQGYFVYADDAGALTSNNLRKISANTATQVTVIANFSEAPDTSTGYEIRTGMIASGSFGAAGGTKTATLPATLNFALNELAGLVLYVKSGPAAGTMRSIASNTAGISSVVTLDYDWETGKIPANGNQFEIRYVTQAKATIGGSVGLAKTFKTEIAKNGGTITTDLDLSFSANQTLNQFINQINANPNYKAYLSDGMNGDTTLMKSFDFDKGAYQSDIRNDRRAVLIPPDFDEAVPLPWPNHFRRDLQLLTDSINSTNQFVTAVRSVGASKGAGSGRPEWTGTGSSGIAGDSAKYLTGGARGSSDNTAWQNAFDKLLQVRCTGIIPLICQDLTNEGHGSTATWASVAAQLQNHISIARGVGKSERGAFIGFKGTRDQFIAKANSFNNEDIAICSQRLTRIDVNNNLVEMDEWVMAVAAAGMRSGVSDVGEPITWKTIRTTALSQDLGWNPADRTDANLLIQNGCLFAEVDDRAGVRWVRDLTTWIKNDNLAYAEGSVRDVIRYISYGLREHIESIFTGTARAATASSIKQETIRYMEEQRSAGIVVDSEDENGNKKYAFHTIRVTKSGDIARIRMSFFPIVGINFELFDLFVQLPRSSA